LQFEDMKEPKTKKVSAFLKACGLEGKKVLFLGDGLFSGSAQGNKELSPSAKFETFFKSLRNIPGQDFTMVPNVSGYDVIVHQDLVIMDTAIDQLKILLAGQS